MAKKQNETEYASLSEMTGRDVFIIKDKTYLIKAIKLKDIAEFEADKIFSAFHTMISQESREKLDKWLNRQLEFNGLPANLEIVLNHDWDLKDLNSFVKAILQISG